MYELVAYLFISKGWQIFTLLSLDFSRGSILVLHLEHRGLLAAVLVAPHTTQTQELALFRMLTI